MEPIKKPYIIAVAVKYRRGLTSADNDVSSDVQKIHPKLLDDRKVRTTEIADTL